MSTTRLMSGCEAAARGAWEAGVHVATSYPGSPVTSVMDEMKRLGEVDCRWATNEKVALEVAAGVAYSGARALVVMKHVGLNVAADALYNLAYTGVRGGLVVVVGDDPGSSCSQNEQDTRLVARAASLPILEPADTQQVLAFTRLAFEISQRHDTPVLVRLTTQLCYGSQLVVTSARRDVPMTGGFAGPVSKFLLLPSHVPARRRALVAKLSKLATSADTGGLMEEFWPEPDTGRHPLGIICAGTTFAAVQENLDGSVPLLAVGCPHPLNADRVRAFARRCDRLVVTEEGSSMLADAVRALGLDVIDLGPEALVGEFRIERLRGLGLPGLGPARAVVERDRPRHLVPINVPVVTAPARPPGFCAGCSHVGPFDVLHRRGVHVVGDIGCYTLGATEPFRALHSNLCMGASVGILQGYLLAQPDKGREVVAVIGDSTFFHSGIPGVITAVQNGHRGVLMVLDNSGTAMTGFQQTSPRLTGEAWLDLLHALGVANAVVVPALDPEAIDAALDHAFASDGFHVLVLKGECVQARPRKGPTNFRYTVIESACTGCNQCVARTDCPSLVRASAADGRPVMSISNECVGCGMCSQTCPERAIAPMTTRTGWDWLDAVLARVEWSRVIRFIRARPGLARLADRLEREQR
ncbi:thiamine pyrophosphate-dependent enzyme [Derxia gummosa]|uniref:Indolepyruvate oxidoreductase subunit IorA n=1 Tax=Derxia gummosa DSM 723 TaxID=1121388 RepID=A0A8B6XAD3_9BURK|nr:thiamine pyrophosphate-dependent enzyme [Derxia gummosa]